MANSPQLPAGWDFTQNGLTAYNTELARFDNALVDAWRARTAARGSTSLDGPDCIDASRFLLTGLKAPLWKIVMRVVAAVAFVLAGIMINNGFAEPFDFLALSAGMILAVVILVLQEALLR